MREVLTLQLVVTKTNRYFNNRSKKRNFDYNSRINPSYYNDSMMTDFVDILQTFPLENSFKIYPHNHEDDMNVNIYQTFWVYI